MSKAAAGRAVLAVAAMLTLTACAPPPRDQLDQDRLNAEIDRTIGGLSTCVVVLDTQTGRKVYRYGRYDICSRGLPPCDTFEPAAALIAARRRTDHSHHGVQVGRDASAEQELAGRRQPEPGVSRPPIGWWFAASVATGRPGSFHHGAERFRLWEQGKLTGPITSFPGGVRRRVAD